VDLMRMGVGVTVHRAGAVLLAATLVTGCQLLVGVSRPSPTPDAAGEWGPLAVVEGGDFGMDAGYGPGRLKIGRRCVTDEDFATTFVWSSGQVHWLEASRTILFRDRDRGQIQLRDGMRVMLGGGDANVLPDLVWLAPVAPACPASTFLVSQVAPPEASRLR
jgi:hypothetical protein